MDRIPLDQSRQVKEFPCSQLFHKTMRGVRVIFLGFIAGFVGERF
jgi:hypothetical protein